MIVAVALTFAVAITGRAPVIVLDDRCADAARPAIVDMAMTTLQAASVTRLSTMYLTPATAAALATCAPDDDVCAAMALGGPNFVRVRELEQGNERFVIVAHVDALADHSVAASARVEGASAFVHRALDAWQAAKPKPKPNQPMHEAAAGTVTPYLTRLGVGDGLRGGDAASAIVTHLGELQYCYEKALLRIPSLRGEVVLAWTVDPEGAVSGAAAAESTLDNPDTVTCIVGRMKAWNFRSRSRTRRRRSRSRSS